MQIQIPHKWLQEYLTTTATPDEIRTNLSLCGPSIERVFQSTGDDVYDIEVTTNRVDCMSVRGLAREAAVILQQFQLPAQFHDYNPNKTLIETNTVSIKTKELPKIIFKTPACRRVVCAVISIDNAVTPPWMQDRLTQIDHQSHGIGVDITNYVTHELGYPCHAFDYDKIMGLGGEIIITTAQTDQEFTTLDGQTHLTKGGEIIFTNPAGEIIDLPAVMGTANTAIDASTKHILFWLENLSPEKVRFASMAHSIRTTAAVLNEKEIDPQLMTDVFYRGLELYRAHAQGQLLSPILNETPVALTQPASITVPWTKFKQYLGIELPPAQITKILTDLELKINTTQPELVVTPPSFRPDLTIAADIVEEVARIYGYHNLPANLSFKTVNLPAQKEFNFALESQFKHYLANIGYQEIYQYSTVSADIASQSGLDLNQHLELNNPLTQDRIYLRTTLLPSLWEIFSQSQATYQGKNRPLLNLFELAKVFKANSDPNQIEVLELSFLSNQPYRQVRADLENMLAQAQIKNINLEPITSCQMNLPGQNQAANIVVPALSSPSSSAVIIGQLFTFGETTIPVIGVQLQLATLLPLAKKYPRYQPLSPYPTITEDLTFTLTPDTKIGPLITQLKHVSPLIKEIKLKDTYENRITLTLSYHDPHQALTTAVISQLRTQIVNQAETNPNLKLVGEL